MRYGRHLRHRRHSRHERHGTKIREFMAGPIVVSIPATATAAVGATLTINATVAGGLAPLTYQWKKGGVNVSGATSKNFTKATAAAGDSGSYTLTVTDAAGKSVTSNACAATVA